MFCRGQAASTTQNKCPSPAFSANLNRTCATDSQSRPSTLRDFILQGFKGFTLKENKALKEFMYKMWGFESVGIPVLHQEQQGVVFQCFLNPRTLLAKQVSPCIFPCYRLPLNPPPRFLQHFFWLRACQAELSTLL